LTPLAVAQGEQSVVAPKESYASDQTSIEQRANCAMLRIERFHLRAHRATPTMLVSLACAVFLLSSSQRNRLLAVPARWALWGDSFGSSPKPSCDVGRESGPHPIQCLERLRRPTMQKGTVKWFNPTKGYGFIRPSTGDKDVFVHISAVERAGLSTLNEGQTVEYELVTGRNGKTSAENLKVG
jgi:CspA family cold shock protein